MASAIPATAAEVGTGSDPGWFWNRPHCDTVYGDGSVTITSTDGAQLAPTKGQVTPVTYPKVAALDAPNTLISIGKQSIQRSSDAGCSWQQIDRAPDDLSTYDVAAGAGESAYVYSVNDQPIHRLQGSEVSLIRSVGGDGQVFDSADNGRTWQKSGVLPAAGARRHPGHAHQRQQDVAEPGGPGLAGRRTVSPFRPRRYLRHQLTFPGDH